MTSYRQIKSILLLTKCLCSLSKTRLFLCRNLPRVTSAVSPSTCCSSIQTGGACSSTPKTVSWGWWIWECKYSRSTRSVITGINECYLLMTLRHIVRNETSSDNRKHGRWKITSIKLQKQFSLLVIIINYMLIYPLWMRPPVWWLRSTLEPQTTERGSTAPSHRVETSSFQAARMEWLTCGTLKLVRMFKK